MPTPCCPASAASRSVPSSPTVEVCTHTAPGAMAGSAHSMTCSTAARSKSIVTTTSAPATASAASVVIRALASARARARSGLRFHTVTSSPAAMRLRAIPEPMIPVPSTATVFVTRSSERSSAGRHPARRRSYPAWTPPTPSGAAERRVERRRRRVERQPPHELQRLRRADQPVHPGVLPLDRDRAVVADAVEHPEARLPRHVAVPGGDEVPAAPRVRPRQVRAHPAVAPVADLALRVLAVDVVDPVLEVPDERHRVEVLPHEVRRVPVEAERLAVADGL